MNVMSAPPVEPADLLDLKFLPAWAKEPGAPNQYDHYTAEGAPLERRSRDRADRHKDRAFPSREGRGVPRRPTSKPDNRKRGRTSKPKGTTGRDSGEGNNRRPSDHIARPASKPFEGTIRFLPRRNV